VPPEYFTDLGTSLKKLSNLRLSNCGLSHDGLIQVTASLVNNPSISRLALDLANNEIGAKGGQALADVLKKASNLTSLNVSNNELRSKGNIFGNWEALVSDLCSSQVVYHCLSTFLAVLNISTLIIISTPAPKIRRLPKSSEQCSGTQRSKLTVVKV